MKHHRTLLKHLDKLFRYGVVCACLFFSGSIINLVPECVVKSRIPEIGRFLFKGDATL